MSTDYTDFGFQSAEALHMTDLILPQLFKLCRDLPPGARVLDIGCGNGFIAGQFLNRGCKVVGIDLSRTGIEQARRTHPAGRFELLAADENVLKNLGEEMFDVVVSTEVIEHVYAPRPFARGCFNALKPGGVFILSTPYHGYLKNLALSLADKWDFHANPLWDGGHIKLWSRQTIGALLAETGFAQPRFKGVGRLPYVWMTMLLAARKPA